MIWPFTERLKAHPDTKRDGRDFNRVEKRVVNYRSSRLGLFDGFMTRAS